MLGILSGSPSNADLFVVAMWIGLIALIFIKQEWFFRFDERFPRLDAIDALLYSDAQKIVFMGARLVVIGVVTFVFGTFIRLIFG